MNAMKQGVQVALRIEQTSIDLADQVAELIGKVTPIKPTRTAVMRAALERGLESLRAEYHQPIVRKRR